MRKYFGYALLAGAILFGLYRIVQSMRSPEDRLHAQMAVMIDGFNRGRVKTALSGFHPEYRDATSGVGKDEVHQALRGAYLQHRSAELGCTLEFEWVEPFDPVFELDKDRASANVKFRIMEEAVTPPRVYWESAAELDFLYEGGAWRITQSRAVDHSGRGR